MRPWISMNPSVFLRSSLIALIILFLLLMLTLLLNLSAEADSGFGLSNIFTLDTRDIIPVQPKVAWDVNSDGEVNIFDIVIVAKNIGQEVKEGDVNGDRQVDILDLVIVASHFGEKLTSASPNIEMAQMDYISKQLLSYLPLLEKAYQLLKSSSHSSPEFEMARKLLERLILLAKPVVKETKLLSNYPNPFNPETWIPYQLAESADVIIRIYDITGRIVWTLNLGRRDIGLYITKDRAAYWDGRNDAGEPVASGAYLYELIAGNFRSVKKMVVLK